MGTAALPLNETERIEALCRYGGLEGRAGGVRERRSETQVLAALEELIGRAGHDAGAEDE
jgi:hypothetical protein